MKQIAEGLFHIAGSNVNWYLIEEGQNLTLIDTGYPGDIPTVESSIRSLGRNPRDVQAVLLTHAHVDHIGGVNHLWEYYQVPVIMHALELPNARGETHEQATPLDVFQRAWRPRVALWAFELIRAGGTKHVIAKHAQALPEDTPLDLPGGPIPIHCPGHTSGHTAYLIPGVGAIATGDALVTGHAISSRTGPQQLPSFFSNSPDTANDTLERLARAEAEILLPGHGDPWRGDMAEAVYQARDTKVRLATC